MATVASLPEPVRRYLGATCGAPLAIERLGGMSGGRVYRVRCPGRSVVVKGMGHSSEVDFYRTVASALAEQGVATPALEWSGQDGETWWLVLEYIPLPLPPERWLADPELLAVLRRLHASEIPPSPERPTAYRPEWTPRMTEAALALLPGPVARQLAPVLETMRRAHPDLFAPRCPISGDPNPLNWGLRDDGMLALYDWERFCAGTPALDLAITVPGLGDAAAFQQVAAAYLQAGRAESPPAETASPRGRDEGLARDIAVAKVWVVVEFLSHHASGAIRGGVAIEGLVQRFPGWVGELACRL
jgi:hypothetical protein